MFRRILTLTLFSLFCATALLAQDAAIVRDSDSNVLLQVNDEGAAGSVTLPGLPVAPGTVLNKLYNVNGTLFFNGVDLTQTGGGGSLWSLNGNDIFYNSGNVGIGTASPDFPLTIQGVSTNSELLGMKDNTGVTEWHLNLLNGGMNFAETLVADGRLFLEPGGDVGIGTIAPTADLHLVGDTGRNTVLLESNQDAGTWLTLNTTAPQGRAWSLVSTGVDNIDGNTQPGRLLFRNSSSPAKTHMSIGAGGNVSIFSNDSEVPLLIEQEVINVFQLRPPGIVMRSSNPAIIAQLQIGLSGIDVVSTVPTTLLPLVLNDGTGGPVTTGGNLNVKGILEVDNVPFGDFGNAQYDEGAGLFYFDNSTRRHKRNIKALTVEFNKLLQAEPKTYTRPERPDRWEIGYIAEEFEESGLIPLLYYDKEGLASGINYSKINLYLTEIVKQRQRELTALQSENTLLKSKLARIEAALVSSGVLSE